MFNFQGLRTLLVSLKKPTFAFECIFSVKNLYTVFLKMDRGGNLNLRYSPFKLTSFKNPVAQFTQDLSMETCLSILKYILIYSHEETGDCENLSLQLQT
jgi:hypothetical protein